MSAENPTVRETLNNGVVMRMSDASRELCMGDVLARLVSGTAADETALDPDGAGNTLNLASAPSCLLDLVANAGTFTGRLELVIDARDTSAPRSGQAMWDGPGSTRLRFNASDAITDLDAWYAQSTDTLSALDRVLGQRD